MNKKSMDYERGFRQGYDPAMAECWSFDGEDFESVVIPGIPYGVRGGLIPNCRTVQAMLAFFNDVDCTICLPENITDDDRAQRGPDGEPLRRVTPMVPYLTRAEWEARDKI